MTQPIAILGLAYDARSSWQRGPAEAPRHVRSAMRSPASNTWSELGIDTSAPGLVHDAGDLSLNDVSGPFERIDAGITALLESGYRPLAIGGDHSVTVQIGRAAWRAGVD